MHTQTLIVLAVMIALSDFHKEQVQQPCIAHVVQQPASISSSSQQHFSADPAKSVILFDLHGVLFHLNGAQAAGVWLANCCKILKRFKKLREIYPTAIQAFKDASEPAANCQTPQEPVWYLIRCLKRHGYPVFLCSNILPETLAALKKQHPEKFALFDGFITTGFESEFVEKDTDAFFVYTRKKLVAAGHADKQIYFFDDKKVNVMAALRHGFRAACVNSSQDVIAAAQRFGLPVPMPARR
jgi:hypothetical protein